ncbi:MAG: hypothetical protein KIPDCIKN_02857 [Haliscomenobacter sp.]|nr:hypothetical protein [Haliscomenobacter sp.]
MVVGVFHWVFCPPWFYSNSWYSLIKNLKFLMNQEPSFLNGLKNNRNDSTQPGRHEQIGEIQNIPENGWVTHPKRI